MKLLIDMNLSPRWCEALADYGIAATHWSELGDPAATDRTIFEWAARDGWIVFTSDLDFGAILAATNRSSPSVIQLRTVDVRPEAGAETIALAAVEACRFELEAGALLTGDAARSQVTALPLRN